MWKRCGSEATGIIPCQPKLLWTPLTRKQAVTWFLQRAATESGSKKDSDSEWDLRHSRLFPLYLIQLTFGFHDWSQASCCYISPLCIREFCVPGPWRPKSPRTNCWPFRFPAKCALDICHDLLFPDLANICKFWAGHCRLRVWSSDFEHMEWGQKSYISSFK